eukprot:CAMPEP_0204482896 /NCGR_PEP_ID=MMETSP0471-20130131/52427_1 /ASSEMBLY_ACC=CAM_ASM_000602 /TAXON_ID=2969 /ORGANISM="Oxyrrhis marina" /LENGTH=82 /DNA_ID=CAMNT_0051486195 /DNA_START=35 /DNA_END=280 /DNA_ORIENTATION=+
MQRSQVLSTQRASLRGLQPHRQATAVEIVSAPRPLHLLPPTFHANAALSPRVRSRQAHSVWDAVGQALRPAQAQLTSGKDKA